MESALNPGYKGLSKADRAKIDSLSTPAKNNMIASREPTELDDKNAGYTADPPSTWYFDNTTYICVDDTIEAAVWYSSNDIYLFDTWNSLTDAIGAAGSTYVNKFAKVANANGGPPAGTIYTAPNAVINPIVDGGEATFKVNAQGTNYSVTCQTRTIVNPTIKEVKVAATARPAADGYYIFKVTPSNGLPAGCSLNDICCLSGGTWSRFQSYSAASASILVGHDPSIIDTWIKVSGTWEKPVPPGTSYENNSSVLPPGYLWENGGAVSRTLYNYLFARIGTTYGSGDGSTTFNLPNHAGRVAVGLNSGDAQFNAIGKTGGEKTHALSIQEMPSHTHDIRCNTNDGGPNAVSCSYTAGYYRTYSTEANGGGQAHNNLQPYITVNYIIKY